MNRGSLLMLGILCAWASAAPLWAAGAKPTSSPLQGGVIAVWLSDRSMDSEAVLKMPVIKGGQVMVQWGEVEKAKGKATKYTEL